MSRPSWQQTWMTIARTVAERSYDPRLKVGAIVVSDDNTRLLSLGYNGNYRGGPHEPDSIDPGQSGFIHAEVNALVKCDYNFNRKKIMYLTHSPCAQCAKLIVNANISDVIYDKEYRDTSGLTILQRCGITVNRFSDDIISVEHHEET
jgi:dCMP deaminase